MVLVNYVRVCHKVASTTILPTEWNAVANSMLHTDPLIIPTALWMLWWKWLFGTLSSLSISRACAIIMRSDVEIDWALAVKIVLNAVVARFCSESKSALIKWQAVQSGLWDYECVSLLYEKQWPMIMWYISTLQHLFMFKIKVDRLCILIACHSVLMCSEKTEICIPVWKFQANISSRIS